MSIYNRFEDIIFESIQEYLTFTHLKSHFNDEWYNFILPHTSPDKLNWTQAETLIKDELSIEYNMSYYIPKNLLVSYQEYFYKLGNRKIGSDSYLFNTNQHFSEVEGSIDEVNDSTLNQYINLAKICFPDWENSEYYSKYFFDLQKSDKKRFIGNYLYIVNNKTVGCGALTISFKEKLAYFHNIAVIPEERKKGYFTNMVKHLINIVTEKGIPESSALSEENSPAYFGFQKMGFRVEDIYYLFETSPS